MLICQLQILGWDARLRRRWARVLLGAVTTWTLLGVLVGYVADLTIDQTVLRWYLPAAAALLLGLDGYRAQREIAADRERLVPRVQADLENAHPPPLPPSAQHRLLKVAREVQDILFATRKQAVRVPQWFYGRFRDADEQDFQANATQLRSKLAHRQAEDGP